MKKINDIQNSKLGLVSEIEIMGAFFKRAVRSGCQIQILLNQECFTLGERRYSPLAFVGMFNTLS